MGGGRGILPAMPVHVVDKPLGPTSHDVVAAARRRLGTRRVGHAGTLDPLASGVLLVLAEDATKLSPYLTGSEKEYLAWVAFGAATPTWDAEGPIEETGDGDAIDAEAVRAALPPFLDLTEQVPPSFSAIKRGGRASYRDARRGEADELPARPAGYVKLDLLAFGRRDELPARFGPGRAGWGPAEGGRALPLPPALTEGPTALIRARVSAGTYVRAFARDLGLSLGVPAHLAGLTRTRVGSVGLERAVPPEAIDAGRALADVEALPIPRSTLSAAQAARVRQGQRLPVGEVAGEGTVALVDPDGRMAAVASLAPEGMRLLRVWPA